MTLKDLKACFNILKQEFPGYEDRPQQVDMAEEVFACLRQKEKLIVEAGTGVGKTFAYLIPAILSKEKTIVSTASIALQDQLVNKDLIALKKILPYNFSFDMLKGKNNYLCLKREKEFVSSGEEYDRFREWVCATDTGDKDEMSFIPDFWFRVCGDSDDCSGRECPDYNGCFYYRHYRDIANADIVVINHHLLMYDILSEFNLLPFHNQLIIDEAHQVEGVISHVFGAVLSRSRFLWLLYRLKGLKITVEHLFEPVELFFKGRDLQASLFHGPLTLVDQERVISLQSQTIYPIPESVIAGLENLKGLLALNKVLDRLNHFREEADAAGDRKDRAETTKNYVKTLLYDMEDFIEQGDKEKVYYTAWNKGCMELKSSMVEAQAPFNGLITCYDSLVMTSATLAAGGKFNFLKDRLGITGFRERVIGSPFDYRRQALLYIDECLPPPDKENSEIFQQESLKTIEGLIHASKGRALILFTSYNHLNFAAKNIKIDYPFKAQGEMPPARLLEWFKETPNAVLLATATFWQGIDIKGEDLSLVVIVKMPFGSPGDPVYDERCRRLKERWFQDLALPAAILMLRQGFGRLIRGTDDRGVVAILDSRVKNSSYGKAILSSLPEMDIVHSIDAVQKFFLFRLFRGHHT